MILKIIFLIFRIFVINDCIGVNSKDVVNYDISGDTYCDGTGWLAYKDEKCFKLIEMFAIRNEANELCAQEWLQSVDSSTPQLVTIKSSAEQDYLTEFLFDKSAVEVNVWIGAKRQSENQNKFVWDDGASINFANWAESNPTENVDRACVVMQSILMKTYANASEQNARTINGKWRDVTCKSANYVLCQKLQRWSFSKLQRTLLDQRIEFDKTQNRLSNTEIKLIDTETKLSNTQHELSLVQKNPVPIGFIYVQLPTQPDPSTLWSTLEWKDVTSEYAGLFFRAEGGGAAQFGTEQQENAPRVTEVQHRYYTSQQNWQNTILSPGGWSSLPGVFSGTYVGVSGHSHIFHQSGGEVRPRNKAMRIWKRIN